MRVLFVHDERGFLGGVERYVADASRGLAARGHACHLAYRRDTGRGIAEFDDGFQSVRACEVRGDALAAEVRRLDPDVLFAHKVESIAPVVAAAAGRPVVRMVHDHDLTCPRRHRYDAYRGRVCHRAAGWSCLADLAFVERARAPGSGVSLVNVGARLAELARHRRGPRLFVASHYMMKELVRNGCDEDRVRVVPPCVEVGVRPPTPLPPEPRLLYVGQLVRGKGVDLLLEALARLPAEFELDVVGDGNARSDLAGRVERLGLSGRVRLAGWADGPAKRAYFESARIVVMPCRWPEPFGLVGVEAMAHGRPVVAFDVGGIAEWLEHKRTGLLVPEQDVGGLAAAIEAVHRTPGLGPSLAAAGRQRYDREYRYEHLVCLLEAELGRVASLAA